MRADTAYRYWEIAHIFIGKVEFWEWEDGMDAELRGMYDLDDVVEYDIALKKFHNVVVDQVESEEDVIKIYFVR
jgi:hypothetical protein